MYKRNVFLLVLVLVFSYSLTAQQHVDAALTKCLGDRYHDLSNNEVNEVAIFQGFEDQLLNAGMLNDNSQESYAMLMANLLNNDIDLPISDWSMMNPDLEILSMPSNLVTSLLCFDDVYETQGATLSASSSVISMAPFIKRIIGDYNLGDKANNIKLVRSVNSEDFSKITYRAPILVLLHNIGSYKEEMYELTSNY